MTMRSLLKCRSWPAVQPMEQRYADALANVRVIIDEWIETAQALGRPVPVPRALDICLTPQPST